MTALVPGPRDVHRAMLDKVNELRRMTALAVKAAIKYPSGSTFNNAREAMEYGRTMSSNVYGASVHKVIIHERTVSEWSPVEEEDHLEVPAPTG